MAARRLGASIAARNFGAGLEPLVLASYVAGLLIALGVADGGFFRYAWSPTIAVSLAVAAAAFLIRDQVDFGTVQLGFVGLLAALAAWTALSTLWSVDPAASLREAYRDAVYLSFVVAVLSWLTRAAANALVGAVVAAAGVICLVGFAQTATAKTASPQEGRLLFQPLGYANGVGALAAIGLVLCASRTVLARSWLAALMRALPIGLFAPALALTNSRGGEAVTIVVVVPLAMYRFWLRSKTRPVLVLGAVLALTAIVMATVERGGTAGRGTYWRAAYDEFLAHPLAGSGAGTFAHYLHRVPHGVPFATNPHSLYLQVLAELGVIGLLLAVGFMLIPLASSWRSSPSGIVAGAGFAVLALHAGLDWDWQLPAVTVAGLACGCSATAAGRVGSGLLIGERSRLAAGAIAGAGAIAVLVATAA